MRTEDVEEEVQPGGAPEGPGGGGEEGEEGGDRANTRLHLHTDWTGRTTTQGFTQSFYSVGHSHIFMVLCHVPFVPFGLVASMHGKDLLEVPLCHKEPAPGTKYPPMYFACLELVFFVA